MLSGKESGESASNGTSAESEGSTKQSLASQEKMKLSETHTEESIVLKKQLSSESNGASQSEELSASIDPVNILHFSPESVLVVETLEDDGVSIIPPSPDAISGRITPLVIPSTPSLDVQGLEYEDSVLASKAEDNLKPGESLHRRITFSQESQDNTPLSTRVALAEHVKQLVTKMQSTGSEGHSKRAHHSSSDSSQETSAMSTKRVKGNSYDEETVPSQPSPLGGRTYKMISRHDRAGSTSPRGLPAAHERRSEKKASRPTSLFPSQESVTALPSSQGNMVDTPENSFCPPICSSAGNFHESLEDYSPWQLRLTGIEASPPNSSNDESATHVAGERVDLRKEETVYTSALECAEESDHNDESVHLEEADRLANLEPLQMKILRYRNAAPKAIPLESLSRNGVSDTQELLDDQIRIFRSVRGRQQPVISSQSQDNNSQPSENSTQILLPRNAAMKRIHSEEEENERATRPKTCHSSVQTDAESSIDNDTPNTSREIAVLKPRYLHQIKEEHTTYLLKCTEDGKVVKSIVIKSKSETRMATDEEIGLISSSNSSTGTSHMSSLTSGELADISSMCPSSKSTSASSLHSLQQQSVAYSEQTSLDHSKDSDKSPTGSLEKQPSFSGRKLDQSTQFSSCESLAPRDPLFTRPSVPSKRTPISRLQSSLSDSSSGPSGLSTFSETRSANKASAKNTKVHESSPRRRGRPRKDERSQTADTTRIVPCSPLSPELSASYQVDDTEDIDSSIQVNLQPGLKVMARWVDDYFYLGEIKKEESSVGSATKRWSVLFHDGCMRTLREEDILPFDLLQEGQSVFAHSSDGCIEPGVIQGFFRNDKEEGFIVDLDSSVSRRFSHANVVLSVDQAACIMKGRGVCPNVTAVSLDNIVDGRRKRTPVLKTPKKNRKPDSNLETTEASDTSEDPHKTPVSRYKSKPQAGKGGSPGRKGKLVPVNLAHQLQTPEDVVKSTRTSPRKKEAMDALISAMGPIPEEGSTIFQNFAFLISCAERKHLDPKKRLLDFGRGYTGSSSSEQSTSEAPLLCSFEEPSYLVDKNYLRSQLEAGGGQVLDSFESAQLVKNKKVILLANAHLRTLKYVQCLAVGIRCITTAWVMNCSQKNQYIDESQYFLPSGYSITSNKLVEWHGETTVLKDLHILLVSRKNQYFVSTWKPVLLAAQAEAVYRLTSSELTETSVLVDVVVTDFSCPEKVLDRASHLKIPVVSTEWVVQCLINGYRLPVSAHPKFRFDYKE